MSPTARRAGPDPARILNYTTEVPVERTLREIKAILLARKAASLTEVYTDGKVTAIEFVYPTGWGNRPFLLPAKPAAVLSQMLAHRNAGKSRYDRYYVDPAKVPQSMRDQAERTAWRTVKDWLEAQMALMISGQVLFEQVFLPYALVDEDRTMFDVYAERQAALPERATA